MTGNSPLTRPPEGVIEGDSIPRENEEEEIERAAIDEMVGILKGHPAYRGKGDSELREVAKEKLL